MPQKTQEQGKTCWTQYLKFLRFLRVVYGILPDFLDVHLHTLEHPLVYVRNNSGDDRIVAHVEMRLREYMRFWQDVACPAHPPEFKKTAIEQGIGEFENIEALQLYLVECG